MVKVLEKRPSSISKNNITKIVTELAELVEINGLPYDLTSSWHKVKTPCHVCPAHPQKSL